MVLHPFPPVQRVKFGCQVPLLLQMRKLLRFQVQVMKHRLPLMVRNFRFPAPTPLDQPYHRQLFRSTLMVLLPQLLLGMNLLCLLLQLLCQHLSQPLQLAHNFLHLQLGNLNQKLRLPTMHLPITQFLLHLLSLFGQVQFPLVQCTVQRQVWILLMGQLIFLQVQ